MASTPTKERGHHFTQGVVAINQVCSIDIRLKYAAKLPLQHFFRLDHLEPFLFRCRDLGRELLPRLGGLHAVLGGQTAAHSCCDRLQQLRPITKRVRNTSQYLPVKPTADNH